MSNDTETTVPVSNIAVRVPERRRPGDSKAKWVAGKSGNPAGKKPGTKNKLTLYREAVLMKQEKKLLQNLPGVLDVVIEKALAGDMTATKLFLERVLAAKKVAEEGEQKGSQSINIIIQGAKGSATLGNPTINAEFEVMNDEEPEEIEVEDDEG